MSIIIKASKNDSTRDLIRRFKKATSSVDVVNRAKDRRYNVSPAEAKNVLTSQKRRLKKKVRSLKKMKNVPPQVITRLTQRLAEQE